MRPARPLTALLAVAAMATGFAAAPAATELVPATPPNARIAYVPGRPRTLTERDGAFQLDGKPFQFILGEIHYPRVPRELWRDRLRKAKAMGVNCVSAYVFWSYHEKTPGVFDFTGNADVAEFVKTAHAEGLFVYLRPGPYVCAEYDFGGYPYWLLNIPDLRWRTRDPKFIALMQRYIDALAGQLKDLQLDRGGPIAFVQVENEYGSYSNDKTYLATIRDMLKKAGFTARATTCDGGSQMPAGKLDGCLPTINGSLGQDIFDTINRHHRGGPFFVSEFYPAWFDVWGKPHSRMDTQRAADQFEWMISRGVNVSLYMFHGGTNFAYTNGANNPPYAPQPTSYDYDAPLGEYGNITPKYLALRAVVQKHLPKGAVLPPVPPQPKVVTVAEFKLDRSVSLDAVLPTPVVSEKPLTMEALHQDYGYVLYRTTLTRPGKGRLVCKDLRDFAVVLLDGKPVGQMDRRLTQDTIPLTVEKTPATLDILVENVGRVNYGKELLHNHKGITESVTFAGAPLTGWSHYPLPLHRENVFGYPFGAPVSGRPAFHRGTFTVRERGEVFLDLGAWGKGAVWVNGHSLGKFWSIGPQQTMYLPSCWVKEGVNDVVVFELDDRGTRTVAGLAAPVLDKLGKDVNAGRAVLRDGADPQLDPADRSATATLARGTAPQTIRFDAPTTARHLALEILATHDGSPFTHLAEIEVLGRDGKPIDRKGWQIWYADSEERREENAPADALIDGKPGTYWNTEYSGAKPGCPHVVVIDLGTIHEGVSGLRLTGREPRFNGAPKDVRVYSRAQFFLAK